MKINEAINRNYREEGYSLSMCTLNLIYVLKTFVRFSKPLSIK